MPGHARPGSRHDLEPRVELNHRGGKLGEEGKVAIDIRNARLDPGRTAVAVLSMIVLAAVLAAAEVTVASAAGTEPVTPTASRAEQPQTGTAIGLANPAALFCIKSGGIYSIRKAADNSEYGVCVLPDGKEIDAWEFFRTHVPKN